jgi:ubiquinone/menaquinone biosynthesis C-methylase UbiE
LKQIPFSKKIGDAFQERNYIREENLWLAQSPEKHSSFESLYHALREKEGWIYPDALVEQLPIVAQSDPHYAQWSVRRNSFHRLVQYLTVQHPGSTILDVGCGNGWMAGGLAKKGFQVCGIDLNYSELQQAARTFKELTNAVWLYGNILSDVVPRGSMDCIVLASSLQYFKDVPGLMESLFRIIRDTGEIHVIDTPFYSAGEKDYAVRRSIAYYAKIGYSGFAGHYFHRTFDELRMYSFRVEDHPKRLLNKVWSIFGRGGSPFPWIVIQKS